MAHLDWQAIERPTMKVRYWVRARFIFAGDYPTSRYIGLQRRAYVWTRKAS